MKRLWSVFLRWIGRLLILLLVARPRNGPAPKPVPAPPLPAPAPAPVPAPAPTEVERALAALNQRRAERGVRPLKLDPGLRAAAGELATAMAAGRAQPHDGFPARVRSRGWPYQDRGIRNRGFGNVSEGCSEGGRTPEEAVLNLDAIPDPRELHRRDFEDPAFTHVGIALARAVSGPWARFGGYICVVDYGARP